MKDESSRMGVKLRNLWITKAKQVLGGCRLTVNSLQIIFLKLFEIFQMNRDSDHNLKKLYRITAAPYTLRDMPSTIFMSIQLYQEFGINIIDGLDAANPYNTEFVYSITKDISSTPWIDSFIGRVVFTYPRVGETEEDSYTEGMRSIILYKQQRENAIMYYPQFAVFIFDYVFNRMSTISLN